MNIHQEVDYLSLLDTISDGYILLNLDGSIDYVSPSYLVLTDRQERDLIGEHINSIEKVAHPSNQYTLPSNIDHKQLNDCIHTGEGGKEVVLQTSVSRIKSMNNKLLLSFKDRTELHKAKKWLTIIKKVFKNSSEAIALTDNQGHVELVNQAFSKISGYSSQEIVGSSISILNSGKQDKKFYKKFWHALTHQGEWSGEIWNKRKNGEIYPEWLNITCIRDSENKIVNYIAQFIDITELKTALDKQQYQSYHDSLTKLPNRKYLFENFEKLCKKHIKNDVSFSILFCDLDRFKSINDFYGHNVGDDILKAVSTRIRNKMSTGKIISRSGGDEFIIVMKDSSTNSINEASNQLLELFKLPFNTSHGNFEITCSLGISQYPSDSTNISELISFANIAMQKVKIAGGNGYSIFETEQKDAVLHHINLEKTMHDALDKRQFEVWYQPQINAEKNLVYGVECLIRWRHPEHGFISPETFIPIAEKCGFIKEIGYFVLQTACKQLKIWQQNNIFNGIFAVNVSLRQFDGNAFIDEVIQLLQQENIQGKYLELEVTESLFSEEDNIYIGKLNVFREAGIKVAIDDFGTGYSSLSRLKNLPINNLKIDKSFIDEITFNPESISLIKVLILLAQSFNLEVIAEGVETQKQADVLTSLGCANHQGYLYSKPLPADELSEWLSTFQKKNSIKYG